MPKIITPPRHEIRPEPRISTFPGLDYQLFFEDGRIGSASVEFTLAGIFQEKTELYLQINHHRPICEILSFYPNGDWPEDPKSLDYMRQGVGTMMLNRIKRDALRNKANSLLIESEERFMINFLRKNQFTETSNYFYKLL